MKSYIVLCLMVLFSMNSCLIRETVTFPRRMFVTFNSQALKVDKDSIELRFYKGGVDSVFMTKDTFFQIYLKGGQGGSSSFLGYKYREFDPMSVKRVFLMNNEKLIKDYRIDELDSLPYLLIDTFKVHILQ